MPTVRIVIVGGGLSGLYAAYLLESQGIVDYVLLEARAELGGRIACISALGQEAADSATHSNSLNAFDLGPTWFWPGYQPELDQLVEGLGLEKFAQFETGDMLLERSPNGPVKRVPGYTTSPASTRLIGGMGALSVALARKVPADKVLTGQTVQRLSKHEQSVVIESRDEQGAVTFFQAEHVLLALPPRLTASTLTFEPALPEALERQWSATPTWMAPHAKYIAVYDTAFWREQGLSGEARSALGPLGEIHDASMPGAKAALFGFFGVPARVRETVPAPVLKAHCRAQLARLFGPQAATPVAEFIKDWAQDPLTATPADFEPALEHAQVPAACAATGPWRGCLTGIASEWSAQFPGYLAGAVEAARQGVQALGVTP
ncbi:FAD-dependent oxidoreductase [Pseudomonas sp. 7P_10.2_Bac1]|uniref:flavin monoamine oxidase family protein n=1 Tax=Pseudomonas sp. 7P_10.2_Bac1 TaxID=2971614 RepID=UPI0021C89FCB|nr:FAD-dependent oxidoreductase [Pseudomonas sp. 7P_10.2_Bac1]MCU1727043.1 FAD-dependent oxidoreductase [Pseudomonas sp. 7P_10.2_Bac1]